jgi:hypothetical protein
MPAPNLVGRCRTKGEQKVAHGIPTDILGINEHSSLDRLTPCPTKKKKKKKKKTRVFKQGTEKDTQQKRQGALSALEKDGGPRNIHVNFQ